MRIGLFGGTFNPPHKGHVHVCEQALKVLGLDAIWWMITPQNPLKHSKNIAPFSERMNQSIKIVKNPKIIVTDIERQLKTHKSIDTIHALKNIFPTTQFIWVAGTDNALNLHKWENWQDIIHETGFLFISRPPSIDRLKESPVRILHPSVNKTTHGGRKSFHPGQNIWCAHTPLIQQSSTALRQGKHHKD